MIDPTDQKQLERLIEAFNASYEALRSARERHVDALKQYVGVHYSDNGALRPLPINRIQFLVDVLSNHLAARTPAVEISTVIRELKASALNLDLDVNQCLKEMRFKKWLQRAIKAMMFSGVGVIKIGLAETDRGFAEDVGELYAETVDFDDWNQDMSVRVFEHSGFFGHGTAAAVSDVVDDESYPEDYRQELRDYGGGYSERQLDVTDAQSVGGRPNSEGNRDAEAKVEHWHIWLTRERKIITVPRQRGQTGVAVAKLLRVVDWTGPRSGPFKVLGGSEVPGNVRPLALVAKVRDMHDLANDTFRRMGLDGVNAKSVLAYEGVAAKDVENIGATPNGGTCKVEHLDKIKEMRLRGVDAGDMAFVKLLHDFGNIQEGNPEALSGAAQTADTLGQERIVRQSVSEQVGAMEDAVADLVIECVQDIAWYELTNPLLDRLAQRRVTGTNRIVTVRIHAEHLSPLQDRFLELNFKVKPYSTQPRSPADEWAAFEQLYDKVIANNVEAIGQQGGRINFEGVLRAGARALGISDLLEDCVMWGMPPTVPTQQVRGDDPRKASPRVVNKTQVRIAQPRRQPGAMDAIAGMMRSAAVPQQQGAAA